MESKPNLEFLEKEYDNLLTQRALSNTSHLLGEAAD